MDASPITQALVLFVAVTAATRFILAPLARAGDGIATLFGPQNHALGWPRGVQESDEPWAWRTPQLVVVNQSPHPDDHSGDPLSDVSEVWVDSLSGRFLVPVAPVEAIRLRVRLH
jgi:ABC-type hemin transport system substrate-binding protein